ncbi:NAD-dependent protein deacylase [Serpentinicella sp. ANB-PHB4]|uniref:NAD-dependent protein deacylase n=1 Tax=Serpentinicella sp. ANB-PHB4 TaxID=3074076 RepID=UPI0028650CD9|nr:NAD-dependent protein deacylase [Serpentinicella sp. ANB-PHB4]MDR5658008.1 NAD-dependent protein deacylase [Serpentinicella sp. ANB-PHB4]
MNDKIDKLKKIVEKSSNIVFFGGAGVSTESNIPDFRTDKGIFNKKEEYPPEIMLSYSFFKKHPDKFYKFYIENMVYAHAQPNAAHNALANLEKQGKLRAVITQNIDGLHQKAGSKNVLELHGSIYKNHCMSCDNGYQLADVVASKGDIPRCNKCNGIIRPNVTLYEEALDSKVIEDAINYIKNAEVLIIGGTSLVVYPAAGLINYFTGSNLILINKDQTPYDNNANLVINDSIGETLKKLI